MISGKRILVVDDDFVYKLVTRKMIERTGNLAEVVCADNGLEAIKIVETSIELNAQRIPDIILCDIDMPVMNGWGFIEAFEQIPGEHIKNTEVYMVSSSIDEWDKLKIKSYPSIKDFLTKPLTVELIQSIMT